MELVQNSLFELERKFEGRTYFSSLFFCWLCKHKDDYLYGVIKIVSLLQCINLVILDHVIRS